MHYALVLDIPTHLLQSFGKTSELSSIMYIDVRDVGGGGLTDFLFLGESLGHREIAPSHKSRRRVLHVCSVCAVCIIINHPPYGESYFHIISDMNI